MKSIVYSTIVLIICCSTNHSFAQHTIHDSIYSIADTTERIAFLNKLSARYANSNFLDSSLIFSTEALQLAQTIHDIKGESTALFHIGDVYTTKGKYKKALSHFLRSLKLKHQVKDKGLSVRLYYKMANVLARLKLYPQALKYYYKMMGAYEAGQNKNNYLQVNTDQICTAEDTIRPGETIDIKAFTAEEDDTTVNAMINPSELMSDYDTADVMVQHALSDTLDFPATNIESVPVKDEDIAVYFHDGKKALAYGLMVHVKQPKAGKRTPFAKLSNVGHMFVTLIKFNKDTSILSRSFGFYPKKDNLLSATPLIPSSTSVYKDDSQHEWDEIVGKFISRRKFERILRLVKEYKCKKYNLNTNNCTDFGLEIAAVAGIKIKETLGDWPLGRGNNPANAGQSILEGKVNDEDKDNKTGLLIFNTIRR